MQVRISVGYLYGRCPNAEGLARQKREAYAITELISEKKKNKKTAKSKHPIRKKKKKEKIPTHQAQQHVTTVDRRRNGSRHVAKHVIKHVTKFGDITCQNT